MCRSGTAACALLAALGCQRFADFRDPIVDGVASGDGAAAADGLSCDAAALRPVFVPPTVVLMVDKSGSMGDQLGAQPLSQWAAVLEVLDNQLRDHDPPETRATLHRLLDLGTDENEARRLIACVIAAEIVDVMRTSRPFDRGRFVARLHQLPAMPWASDEDE